MVIREWQYLTGIRRCGLAETGLVSGRNVSLGWAQARPLSLFLLPDDHDVELSAISPAPCLPKCCHASGQDDNELIKPLNQ